MRVCKGVVYGCKAVKKYAARQYTKKEGVVCAMSVAIVGRSWPRGLENRRHIQI